MFPDSIGRAPDIFPGRISFIRPGGQQKKDPESRMKGFRIPEEPIIPDERILDPGMQEGG